MPGAAGRREPLLHRRRPVRPDAPHHRASTSRTRCSSRPTAAPRGSSCPGAAGPSGGESWFPFFVDTGDAATTPQDLVRDRAERRIRDQDERRRQDVGEAEGHREPQARARLRAGSSRPDRRFRRGRAGGHHGRRRLSKHRSRRDLHARRQGSGSIVWGTSKKVYGMWGWACASCGLNEGGPQYQTASVSGRHLDEADAARRPRVGPEQRRVDLGRHHSDLSSARCGPRGCGATSSRRTDDALARRAPLHRRDLRRTRAEGRGPAGVPLVRVSNRRAREALGWAPFHANFRAGLTRYRA